MQERGENPERELSTAERRALGGKSSFGETLDVVKRLSASYRRCYWKSGTEMLFPILYGHLTFASHKCWKVYVKKGVFLAAEAWRRRYGGGLLHGGKQEEGGAIVQFVRPTMERPTLSQCEEEYKEGNDGSNCRNPEVSAN